MTERERFEAWLSSQREASPLQSPTLFDAWCAALSAPAVPPGFVLVPVEPTPEMLMAAVRSREGPAVYNVTSANGLLALESDAAEDYRAMLAAAPSAKETQT